MRWRRRNQKIPLTALELRGEGISAYLDDELSDVERAEIEALFAEDADARDSLADLRLLTTALASLGEVRAPRSFAIPAPAVRAAPAGMFHRMELGIRASAAAAALFFVVALVNQPAGMTVGTFSLDAVTSAENSMAATTAMDARQTADDATAESAGLLAAPESDTTPSDAGEEAPVPTPGDAPAPADGASSEGTGQDAAQDAAKAALAPDAALGAPVTGTTRDAGASDGVGGVAPALATLAALLTALSVLVARGRAGGTGRQ